MEETRQLSELTAAQFWFILVPIAGVLVGIFGYIFIQLYKLFVWSGEYLLDENDEHPTINKILVLPLFLVLMVIWMIISVTIIGLIMMFIVKLIRTVLGVQNG